MTLELKRFDVVLVDFGDNMDSEQSGIRPAIILQNDIGNLFSSTTLVAPLTSQHRSLRQPTHTLIKKGVEKGLVKDSIMLAECLRQVSEKRIKKYLGRISDNTEQKEVRRAYEANFGE